MTDIIGFDHLYIAVSDLVRSEAFYDRVLLPLGFRKNSFALGEEPHVQYYNRHFGYVLRPARSKAAHDPYAPGLHHLAFHADSREYDSVRLTPLGSAARPSGREYFSSIY